MVAPAVPEYGGNLVLGSLELHLIDTDNLLTD